MGSDFSWNHSCDEIRAATLEVLKYLDVGFDDLAARQNYFDRVDERDGTNNFKELVKNETANEQKLFNPKWWRPLHAMTNLDSLLNEWDYNWPRKSGGEDVLNMLNDIESEFAKKGLKSSRVPGVKLNQTPQKENKRCDNPTGNNKNSSIKTADKELNPLLDHELLKNVNREEAEQVLKNIDPKIVERILSEVVGQQSKVTWDDIAGLDNVKQAINEIVVYPMQNPELFQGLLTPAKGLLLFGPPGTGKTLIGKCIACESGATFFAISASSLTSKWVGEGEKMVRAMFQVARLLQPSVVFIDEIDSLLTQRVDGEHDSSRRMKTEFLVQFDGVSTGADDKLLIVGATNRPQELDEAARRRFTKRLYVPLPDAAARIQIIENLMQKQKNQLTSDCVSYVAEKAHGFSGADMSCLCKEAAMVTLRSIIKSRGGAKNLSQQDLPPVTRADFDCAMKLVKASVSESDMGSYEEWDRQYGATREATGEDA